MPIRIIHAGLGRWGQDWAQQAIPKVHKEMECVAYVDSNPTSLAWVKKTLGAPAEQCFTSLDAAFATVEADAIVATVSVPAHVPVALAALAADKHVLIEKPFTMTLDQAQQVVDAAEAANCILMISQNYRFYPAVEAAARLVWEQELGKVGAVSVDFRRNLTKFSKDHAYAFIDHPLLLDMAIHHFDLMRTVLNQEPVRVTAQAWNPPWSPIPGMTAGSAAIEFDGGAVVSYRGNWVSRGPDTPWAGEWKMDCERGEIVWTSRGGTPEQLAADRVVVRPLGGKERVIELPTLNAVGRVGVLTAFAAAIRDGSEPPCSGRDNLGTIGLMNAAIASAESGQAVMAPLTVAAPA
ncbi:MAG: Gfo/Idh/MocA family protein [Thermomicrobiales bacterium]